MRETGGDVEYLTATFARKETRYGARGVVSFP